MLENNINNILRLYLLAYHTHTNVLSGNLGLIKSYKMNFSGEHIGSESPLPYLSPELREQRLLVGANFASVGIGILSDTGIQFVSSLPVEFLTDRLILSNFLLSISIHRYPNR